MDNEFGKFDLIDYFLSNDDLTDDFKNKFLYIVCSDSELQQYAKYNSKLNLELTKISNNEIGEMNFSANNSLKKECQACHKEAYFSGNMCLRCGTISAETNTNENEIFEEVPNPPIPAEKATIVNEGGKVVQLEQVKVPVNDDFLAQMDSEKPKLLKFVNIKKLNYLGNVAVILVLVVVGVGSFSFGKKIGFNSSEEKHAVITKKNEEQKLQITKPIDSIKTKPAVVVNKKDELPPNSNNKTILKNTFQPLPLNTPKGKSGNAGGSEHRAQLIDLHGSKIFTYYVSNAGTGEIIMRINGKEVRLKSNHNKISISAKMIGLSSGSYQYEISSSTEQFLEFGRLLIYD